MKLSAAKRNQLIIVGIVTAMIIGAIWYYLIGALNAKKAAVKEKQLAAEEQRRNIDNATKVAAQVEKNLISSTEKLNLIRQEMASGDLYSWMYGMIKKFSRAYQVDIPQFSTVDTAENNLIPQFPYKQVKISIAGYAYFQDFGRFLADFENQYPHIRVENLNLEPATGPEQFPDRERLSFRMEIIALVDNNTATAIATETK